MRLWSEAVAGRYSVKKVFLEMPQNSQENTCVRFSFLIKLQELTQASASGLQLYLKRDTGVFLWIFEISKNTFFFTEHLQWLLLSWKLIMITLNTASTNPYTGPNGHTA